MMPLLKQCMNISSTTDDKRIQNICDVVQEQGKLINPSRLCVQQQIDFALQLSVGVQQGSHDRADALVLAVDGACGIV